MTEVRLVLAMLCVVVFAPRAMTGDEPSRLADVVSPTVQLRNGEKTGSGTVIRSVRDDTLILTAAHVVRDAGDDLKVEIHRHNLHPGTRIAVLTEGGGWPHLARATVEALDLAGDVALVRIRGMSRLPAVSRFDPESPEPARGNVLTSLGIDRSLHLTRWSTRIEGAAKIEAIPGAGERRFTVTAKYPEHGRSGGGLFRADGTLVGVCVGQLIIKPGQPKVGLFASMESVRKLFESFESTTPMPIAGP